MTAYLPGSSFDMRTPLEQMRGELAEMQKLWQEKPEVFIVMNELTLRSLHVPVIREHLQWLEKGWHDYLERVLREGREQHFFRADLDPAPAATWLILLLKGTILHALSNPGAVDFQQVRAEVERWLTS